MALKPAQPTLGELADMCLKHLVGNPDELAEFMVQSGIGPADLRGMIGSEGFSHGLIDYVVGNEPLLVAVASANRMSPETIVASWAKLHRHEE